MQVHNIYLWRNIAKNKKISIPGFNKTHVQMLPHTSENKLSNFSLECFTSF